MNQLFKKLISITISLSFIFLSACATVNSTYAPTEEELAQADYGEKPIDYKPIIKAYVLETLIDPESARFYNFSIPKKDWLSEFEGFGVNKYFGWLVCVNVNAKNRTGGYTGKQPHHFIMRGNKITFVQINESRKNISFSAKYPVMCKYN